MGLLVVKDQRGTHVHVRGLVADGCVRDRGRKGTVCVPVQTVIVVQVVVGPILAHSLLDLSFSIGPAGSFGFLHSLKPDG